MCEKEIKIYVTRNIIYETMPKHLINIKSSEQFITNVELQNYGSIGATLHL